MATDRLLGSFLVRISARDGVRTISLHSVLTGESQRFARFQDLAHHLERATGGAADDDATTGDATPDRRPGVES